MSTADVKVLRCKNDREAESTISKFLEAGYTVQGHDVKNEWSPLWGFLAPKHVHTITFVKES